MPINHDLSAAFSAFAGHSVAARQAPFDEVRETWTRRHPFQQTLFPAPNGGFWRVNENDPAVRALLEAAGDRGLRLRFNFPAEKNAAPHESDFRCLNVALEPAGENKFRIGPVFMLG